MIDLTYFYLFIYLFIFLVWERDRNIDLFTHCAFIGWSLYLPWPGRNPQPPSAGTIPQLGGLPSQASSLPPFHTRGKLPPLLRFCWWQLSPQVLRFIWCLSSYIISCWVLWLSPHLCHLLLKHELSKKSNTVRIFWKDFTLCYLNFHVCIFQSIEWNVEMSKSAQTSSKGFAWFN